MNKNEIRTIETIAANAWLPESEQELGGWHLRFSRGITRRGNSVLPLADGGKINLAEKIKFVEKFYSDKNLPSVFQLTKAAQPASLHKTLLSLGYQDQFHTQVQTASTSKLLQQSAGETSLSVTLETSFDPAWFSFYADSNPYTKLSSEVRENILRQIPGQNAFISLKEGGNIVSIGLGVIENKQMGIYCMHTAKNQRRRGAATNIIRALADWASSNFVNNVYLQVMEDNFPALGFYSKAGFEKRYRYWYSEKSFDS